MKEVLFEEFVWDRSLVLDATKKVARLCSDGFGYVDGVSRWPLWVEESIFRFWAMQKGKEYMPGFTPETIIFGAEGLAMIMIGPHLAELEESNHIIQVEPRLAVVERSESLRGRVFSPFSARTRTDIFEAGKMAAEEASKVAKVSIMDYGEVENMIFGVRLPKGVYAKNFRLRQIVLFGEGQEFPEFGGFEES